MMTCLLFSPSVAQCGPVFSPETIVGRLPALQWVSCQSSVSSRPLTMSVMTCTICAETITDRAMKAGDKLYHEEHFACTQCGLSLAGADVAIYTKQESGTLSLVQITPATVI